MVLMQDTNVCSAGYSGICPLTCIQFGFELESRIDWNNACCDGQGQDFDIYILIQGVYFPL